jgi:F-type H+-transporting ATPase subunit delta
VQPVAVAKRYARALADYAESKPGDTGRSGRKDSSRLESLASELALVSSVLDGDPKFARFFADPSIEQKNKKAALEGMAGKAKLSEAVRNFLLLLLTNRRLGALGEIARAFELEKDARLGIVSVETTSAVPLSAGEVKRLREALEKMTGRTVKITQNVDPALLGGARTRIGSRVYDGTLRRNLDALREKLIGAH